MFLPQHPYCLFVPASPGSSQGKLYVLNKSEGFRSNSFVLLPYFNPTIKPGKIYYFSIESVEEINLDAYRSNVSTPKMLLKARTTKEAYIEKIKQLKQQIQQGRVYEINYCISFLSEPIEIDAWHVFLKLNQLARAPYSCLLKMDTEYILCASPELFLEKKGSLLYSKPIKGTIKRGKSPKEDEVLKTLLYTSVKERTENVMAVDVARNDLSRLAQKGSVRVNKLYNIESFETVHQMVSTVQCELQPGINFERIIDATFPMASMTGAPKISAMNLIETHEQFKRNYYSGAMGLVDEDGNFNLCVIIRSIFYDSAKKEVSFAVGGAITYLSEAEKEYDECVLKAKTMLEALNGIIIDS